MAINFRTFSSVLYTTKVNLLNLWSTAEEKKVLGAQFKEVGHYFKG